MTTSNVRHQLSEGVFARTGNALVRAQPAQIEPFARKKSRRFITRPRKSPQTTFGWGSVPGSKETISAQNAEPLFDTVIHNFR